MPSFLWGGATGRAAGEASGTSEAGSALQMAQQKLMMRKPLHAWWAADTEGTGDAQ
jgi:hypothetical protein